jgi:hypothetical protein
VVESRDNGRTWNSTEIRGLPENIALGNILSSPRGFLFGEDRVFRRNALLRSHDNGKTWQTLPIGRVPEALSIHPTTGTLFIAGSPVMFSADNGTTWQASRGLPFRSTGRFEGASELAFGTDPLAQHSKAALAINIRNVGLFYSNDGGISFQASSPLISTAYTVKAAPNGTFYALTQNSVWTSTDGGSLWNTRNNGLSGLSTDLALNDISFDSVSNAYLSTSRGIYRLEQSRSILPKNMRILTKVEKRDTGEQTLRISPNPASEETFVTFSLAQSEHCRLEVFNMQGNIVQTLSSGNLTPSPMYRFVVRLNNLPQGQYLCRLQHGSQISSQILTVLR